MKHLKQLAIVAILLISFSCEKEENLTGSSTVSKEIDIEKQVFDIVQGNVTIEEDTYHFSFDGNQGQKLEFIVPLVEKKNLKKIPVAGKYSDAFGATDELSFTTLDLDDTSNEGTFTGKFTVQETATSTPIDISFYNLKLGKTSRVNIVLLPVTINKTVTEGKASGLQKNKAVTETFEYDSQARLNRFVLNQTPSPQDPLVTKEQLFRWESKDAIKKIEQRKVFEDGSDVQEIVIPKYDNKNLVETILTKTPNLVIKTINEIERFPNGAIDFKRNVTINQNEEVVNVIIEKFEKDADFNIKKIAQKNVDLQTGILDTIYSIAYKYNRHQNFMVGLNQTSPEIGLFLKSGDKFSGPKNRIKKTEKFKSFDGSDLKNVTKITSAYNRIGYPQKMIFQSKLIDIESNREISAKKTIKKIKYKIAIISE